MLFIGRGPFKPTMPHFRLPVLTDLNILQVNLDSTLFPGIDKSVLVHEGFAGTHSRYATILPFQLFFPDAHTISGPHQGSLQLFKKR